MDKEEAEVEPRPNRGDPTSPISRRSQHNYKGAKGDKEKSIDILLSCSVALNLSIGRPLPTWLWSSIHRENPSAKTTTEQQRLPALPPLSLHRSLSSLRAKMIQRRMKRGTTNGKLRELLGGGARGMASSTSWNGGGHGNPRLSWETHSAWYRSLRRGDGGGVEVKFGDGLRQAQTGDVYSLHSTLSMNKQNVRLPLNSTIALCYCCCGTRETGPKFYMPSDSNYFTISIIKRTVSSQMAHWLGSERASNFPWATGWGCCGTNSSVQVLEPLSEANTDETIP